MAAFRSAFANALPTFTRISGCVGSTIPDIVADNLRRDFPAAGKGGLGATLSHVFAWEKILQSDKPYGIVLEDDTQPIRNFPQDIEDLGIGDDFDVCFANQRMSMNYECASARSSYISCTDALRSFATNHKTPGGDCYILSKNGAEKLLQMFSADGFGSFLDWRIVAYCVSRDDAKLLRQDGIARTVIDIMHSHSKAKTTLTGRVLISPLVDVVSGLSDIWTENSTK